MFLRTAKMKVSGERIEATPTTTDGEKNPAGSISADRRAISDMRRSNLRFDSRQYYATVAHASRDIARWAMGMVGNFHGLHNKEKQSDVAPTFRFRRFRPACSLAMFAGCAATQVHFADDLARFWRDMPFGRCGSPSHVGRFGDAITQSHAQYGILGQMAQIELSFRSAIYAHGGGYVDVNVKERLLATVECWGDLTRGLLGLDSTNEAILMEEESRGSHQILVGFAFNLGHHATTLQKQKIDGSGIHTAVFYAKMGLVS